MRHFLIYCFFALILFGSCQSKEQLKVSGSIIGPVEDLLLFDASQDIRLSEKSIIRVDSAGNFSFVIQDRSDVVYYLISKSIFEESGGAQGVLFFQESGTEISWSRDFNQVNVKGGTKNAQLADFFDWSIESASELYEKDLTPAEIAQEFLKLKLAQFEKEFDIAKYYLLLSDCKQQASFGEIDTRMIDLLEDYQGVFPNHPYTSLSSAFVTGYQNGELKDFVLPNFAGENSSLLELTKNKKSVINLWATWCGNCISKSRKLAELYEKYGEEKFEVVAIAAFDNREKLEKVMEKELYLWPTLLEEKHRNQVWTNFGLGNIGGDMFLVNSKGEIVKKSPTIDEIENFILD